MTQKALVVLSGGQDSTTCLFWALAQGWEVHAVTFNYGQKHATEIDAARQIAQMAGIGGRHEVVSLGPILAGYSPLTNPSVQLEQYADHKSLPGGLEKTFVPMRNQLFLTVAANRAYVLGAQILVTGVCQEDSGGYPDCRQTFINYLQKAINAGTFTGEDGAIGPLRIETPLMNLTKADSVELALELPGAYAALAHSHTAYDGAYPPVGKDHATLLREKGFVEAGVPDPLWLRYAMEQFMAAQPGVAFKSFLPDLPLYQELSDAELTSYCNMGKLFYADAGTIEDATLQYNTDKKNALLD